MSTSIAISVCLRLCRKEDLPAVEWMGLHTREREIIAEAFAAQERGEQLMLLADANGFPIGQAWLDFARRGSERCPRLWAVRVFPPLQRAGLGEKLMREAERLAAAHGARQVELGVERINPAARRFYRRLGYVPVGSEREVVRYSFEGCPLSMELDQEILRKELPRCFPAQQRLWNGATQDERLANDSRAAPSNRQ